jgi:hypothetical protein
VSGKLEFVPFHEPHPSGGEVVELAIRNLDHAEQRVTYRATLERNPFALNYLVERFSPTFEDRAENLIGAEELCIECPALTLVVGYPFQGQYAVTVGSNSPRGFTRAELFRQLVRVYSAMYDGATALPTKLTLQTDVDSPRFGAAWHRLDELAIEQVVLQKRDDGRAFAWISIGS